MNQLPLGFGMALAQNPAAMQVFTAMSESEKERVLQGTHAIRSKEEMQQYVSRLLTQNTP